MNKVFKVVWNKARGCYVVASEFAKSHTKSGREMKAVAAVAAVALTLGLNGMALAADIETGTGDGLAIGTGSETVKDTDTAIGKSAQALGTEYTTVDKDGKTIYPSGNTTAIGSNSFAQYSGSTAIGVGAKASGEACTVTIGGQSYPRMGNSTAVGYLSEATKYDSTAVGYTSKAGGRAAIALGARSVASGEAGTATGASSLAHEKFTAAYGAESKAYGDYGTALGAGAQTGLKKKYDTDGNEIIDNPYKNEEINAATTEGTAVGFTAVASNRAATAFGARAEASGDGSTASGASSLAHEKFTAAYGAESKAYGENGTALGAGAQTGLAKYDEKENEIVYKDEELNNAQKDATAVGTDAVASGRASAALGARSTASGDASLALGASSAASGASSAALGSLSAASGDDSLALGTSSAASGSESTALGFQSTAYGDKSMALGVRSTASGEASVTLGVSATASGNNSLALGTSSIASGDRGIAIGLQATAGDLHDSIAIGKSSGASGAVSMALGRDAKAYETYSMALGVSSSASGNSSLALGYDAHAYNIKNVALGASSNDNEGVGGYGYNNQAYTGDEYVFGTSDGSLKLQAKSFNGIGNSVIGTVSIGSDSIKRTLTNLAAGRITATSTDAINGSQLFAVADGLQTQINDLNQKITEGDHYHTVNGESPSTGTGNNAAGGGTTGSGTTSGGTGTGTGSGTASGSTGTTGTAPAGDKPILNDGYISEKGNLSIQYATDENGRKYYDISMKDNLVLSSSGSVKFGDTIINQGGLEFDINHSITKNEIKYGKTVINDNRVKVGDTINIDNSSKNITVGSNVNVDIGGNQIHNVQAGTADTDAVNVSQLKQVEQNVTNNSVQINKLGSRIDKVGAGAAALAALHPLDFDPDDKFYLSAGYGNYRGENAAAIGAFYQPNDDTLFSVSSTVGNDDDMINAGVTWRFGQSSNQSRSKKAMAKEIIELRTEVAELKAMVYNLTGYGLDLEKTKLFPDTPENHWAYDYVAVVAGNGILEGYPDGQFDGSRPMTRYEMAAVVYRLLQKGAQVDNRMLLEFAPELARIKVDTITKHKDGTPGIQRVRVIKGRG